MNEQKIGLISEQPPFLPVELIFNLLCVLRRGTARSPRALRAALMRRGLHFGDLRDLPRLSFWLNLCQRAALLDEQVPPFPTLFAHEWLSLPLEKQLLHLLIAWQHSPICPLRQTARKRLLEKLNAQVDLNLTDRRDLPSLQVLGICSGDQLTTAGRALLDEAGSVCLTTEIVGQWRITENTLVVPYPPKWGLLWQLEVYFDPTAPGAYSLTKKQIRLAAQRDRHAHNDFSNLLEILARGLEVPAPTWLANALQVQPTIRVLPGAVLEFSDSQELLELRKTASTRRDLSHMLSPHHVLLDPLLAGVVYRRLIRKGLLYDGDFELAGLSWPISDRQPATARDSKKSGLQKVGKNHQSELSISERAYLLSLLLAAEGIELQIGSPLGLMAKLVEGLDERLLASAALQTQAALAALSPPPQRQLESAPSPGCEADFIQIIQDAIDKAESLDLLYHTAGRSEPEYRRVSPLLLESRGGRKYLTAYCHLRRANRTFRVGRIKIIDFPEQP